MYKWVSIRRYSLLLAGIAFLIWALLDAALNKVFIGQVQMNLIVLEISIGVGILSALVLEAVLFLHYKERIGLESSASYLFYLLYLQFMFFKLGLPLSLLRHVADNKGKVSLEAERIIKSGRLSRIKKSALKDMLECGDLELLEMIMRLARYEEGLQAEEERQKALPKSKSLVGSKRSKTPNSTIEQKLPRQVLEYIDRKERKDKELVRLRALARKLLGEVPQEIDIALEKLAKLGFTTREFRKASYVIEERIEELSSAGSNGKRQAPILTPTQKEGDAGAVSVEREEDKTESKEDFEALPTRFKWQNDTGEIVYTEHFMGEFDKLEDEEKSRLIKQLNFLAHDPKYPSLVTRRYTKTQIPLTPSPCFVCRGWSKRRFSWTKPGNIVVHYTFLKSGWRISPGER